MNSHKNKSRDFQSGLLADYLIIPLCISKRFHNDTRMYSVERK